jgi:hypothetical protein
VFDISRGDGDAAQQRERSNPRNYAAAFRYLMEGQPLQDVPVPVEVEAPQDPYMGLPIHPAGSTSELVRQRSLPLAQTPADEVIRQYQTHQGPIVKI